MAVGFYLVTAHEIPQHQKAIISAVKHMLINYLYIINRVALLYKLYTMFVLSTGHRVY